jgi:hypothetical protein
LGIWASGHLGIWALGHLAFWVNELKKNFNHDQTPVSAFQLADELNLAAYRLSSQTY